TQVRVSAGAGGLDGVAVEAAGGVMPGDHAGGGNGGAVAGVPDLGDAQLLRVHRVPRVLARVRLPAARFGVGPFLIDPLQGEGRRRRDHVGGCGNLSPEHLGQVRTGAGDDAAGVL